MRGLVTDAANLIAQARELDERGALSGFAWQLVVALEAAEAQRDTFAEAHQAIVARHPDADSGEHPAVDIARAALAGVAPPEEQPR